MLAHPFVHERTSISCQRAAPSQARVQGRHRTRSQASRDWRCDWQVLPVRDVIVPAHRAGDVRLRVEAREVRDVHDQIRRVTPLVEAGHRHGVRVSVGINQISFAPDEYVATYSAAMHEAGAPEIMLYDGGSGMGPEAYAFMVGLVCEHAPDAVVGVHTHNMFDLAVATALESAKAGARVLEVSVNGYCSASGQADLAATTMALNALYGVKTGIDLSKLTPLARLAEKIVGYEIAWNHPVTGREVFNWGGTELVKNAIGSVVDEMVLTVVRIAYSSIMKDTMDLSSAFCDRNGRMIAQGLSLPLHLGSIPDAMQAVIGKYGNDIAPGDVVVLNDPYEAGGMHLPDIFMFVPVFVDDYLLGYAVLVGHYNDVGGRVPGSSAADSTEIYQEGLRIPVLKLYERGRANETLLELIRINVRIPDVVLGDLQAQLAACRIGERGVSELARRYGIEGLERHFEELLAYSERAARQTIRSIPDGAHRDGLDGVANPAANIGNAPCEVVERQAPLRIERYELVPDSGGAGQWRSAVAASRCWGSPTTRAGFGSPGYVEFG